MLLAAEPPPRPLRDIPTSASDRAFSACAPYAYSSLPAASSWYCLPNSPQRAARPWRLPAASAGGRSCLPPPLALTRPPRPRHAPREPPRGHAALAATSAPLPVPTGAPFPPPPPLRGAHASVRRVRQAPSAPLRRPAPPALPPLPPWPCGRGQPTTATRGMGTPAPAVGPAAKHPPAARASAGDPPGLCRRPPRQQGGGGERRWASCCRRRAAARSRPRRHLETLDSATWSWPHAEKVEMKRIQLMGRGRGRTQAGEVGNRRGTGRRRKEAPVPTTSTRCDNSLVDGSLEVGGSRLSRKQT